MQSTTFVHSTGSRLLGKESSPCPHVRSSGPSDDARSGDLNRRMAPRTEGGAKPEGKRVPGVGALWTLVNLLILADPLESVRHRNH